MIYDDRDASPGEKFADAELLGCPLRLTVGRKGVEAGEVETQVRRGQEKGSLPLEGAAAGGGGAVARPSLTKRQLSGLDRSGGPPPETLQGPAAAAVHDPQPDLLRAARAAAGVHGDRVRAPTTGATPRRRSSTSRSPGATSWTAWRPASPGQYSRLGALLDPLTDRALVLAGVIVCFHFELLPRWALVVLAARELFMLVLTQSGLRKGMDLKINMVGRWAVWPVMFAIFLTLLVATPGRGGLAVSRAWP